LSEVSRVASSVAAADIHDGRIGLLHLDLERRYQRVFGFYEDVIRLPRPFDSNRKL